MLASSAIARRWNPSCLRTRSPPMPARNGPSRSRTARPSRIWTSPRSPRTWLIRSSWSRSRWRRSRPRIGPGASSRTSRNMRRWAASRDRARAASAADAGVAGVVAGAAARMASGFRPSRAWAGRMRRSSAGRVGRGTPSRSPIRRKADSRARKVSLQRGRIKGSQVRSRASSRPLWMELLMASRRISSARASRARAGVAAAAAGVVAAGEARVSRASPGMCPRAASLAPGRRADSISPRPEWKTGRTRRRRTGPRRSAILHRNLWASRMARARISASMASIQRRASKPRRQATATIKGRASVQLRSAEKRRARAGPVGVDAGAAAGAGVAGNPSRARASRARSADRSKARGSRTRPAMVEDIRFSKGNVAARAPGKRVRRVLRRCSARPRHRRGSRGMPAGLSILRSRSRMDLIRADLTRGRVRIRDRLGSTARVRVVVEAVAADAARPTAEIRGRPRANPSTAPRPNDRSRSFRRHRQSARARPAALIAPARVRPPLPGPKIRTLYGSRKRLAPLDLKGIVKRED